MRRKKVQQYIYNGRVCFVMRKQNITKLKAKDMREKKDLQSKKKNLHNNASLAVFGGNQRVKAIFILNEGLVKYTFGFGGMPRVSTS